MLPAVAAAAILLVGTKVGFGRAGCSLPLHFAVWKGLKNGLLLATSKNDFIVKPLKNCLKSHLVQYLSSCAEKPFKCVDVHLVMMDFEIYFLQQLLIHILKLISGSVWSASVMWRPHATNQYMPSFSYMHYMTHAWCLGLYYSGSPMPNSTHLWFRYWCKFRGTFHRAIK